MQPARPAEAIASQVPQAIAHGLRQIGRVIDPPATAALYAQLHAQEPYGGVRVWRGEAYGPHDRNLLDVFAPAAAGAGSGRPVLVFVHGGGFTGGSRRNGLSPYYDNIMLWASAHGMVGVNMTYRLAPDNPWPAAQQDLQCAIAWIHRHIARFGGDAARIAVIGHSAGAAHVAQYLGHAAFHAAAGGGIACAVLICGIFDPSTAEQTASMQAYFGTDAARHAQRSALPGLAAAGVPLLIAFAELDPPQFGRQAEQAVAALAPFQRDIRFVQALGHSHLSVVYAFNTGDRAVSDCVLGFVTASFER